MTATVIYVPVPEADVAIDRYRQRLDPTCRKGVGAHVTVLVPFMDAAEVTTEVRDQLRELFLGFSQFEFVLRRTRWFDERVLWLEPEPSEPFRKMTLTLVERFPGFPPYSGAYPDTVPHVTIGEGGRWRKRRRPMHRAETLLDGMDPIVAKASEAWLMEQSPKTGCWNRSAAFEFGPG